MNDSDRRWLARLRLERDPFPETDSAPDFFPRGSREKQLELLLDTSTLGRPLITMIGESGIGKTTFFHALLERLPCEARVARITAGVFLSARALLQAVARAMGVELEGELEGGGEGEMPVEVLRAQLHARMITLGRAGTPSLIVVDDAGELDAEALEELMQLAELARDDGHRIRIILFALPGLREALALAAGEARVDALTYEMVLDRYSLNELRGYLQFRLARAGLKGAAPFGESEYQEIFRRSSGLPGRANVVAGRILRERRGGLQPNQVKWIVSGVSAALLLGAALLLLPGGALDDASGVARMASPAGTTVDRATTRPGPVPLPSLLDDDRTGEVGSGSDARRVSTGAAGTSAGDWLPLPGGTAARPAAATGGPGRAVTTPAPDAAPAGATTAAVRAEAPAADRSDADMLLRADPAHFTLQLLVSSTVARSDAWIAAQQRPQDFRQYRRLRDGARQFVVVYGEYPDRAAANRAAERVAAETGVAAPWIRRLGDIQAEVAPD